MSKLYSLYQNLKSNDNETIYLFRSGIFLISLSDDALTLSKIFNFKINNLNKDVIKCGFPYNSFEKYKELFKMHNLKYRLIDTSNISGFDNNSILNLLEFINSVDINSLSIKEAYQFIEDLQYKANSININNS